MGFLFWIMTLFGACALWHDFLGRYSNDASLSSVLQWLMIACLFVSYAFICELHGQNQRGERKKEKEEIARSQFACQRLLSLATHITLDCERICNASLDEGGDTRIILPDALSTWFEDTQYRHGVVVDHNILGEWVDLIHSALEPRFKRVKALSADQCLALDHAVGLMIKVATDLESVRKSDLRGTRLVAREVRFEVVLAMLKFSEVIYSHPDYLARHLVNHGSPAALRDVIQQNMDDIMLGNKPWRDALLQYVFSKTPAEATS
jgi:hypothetical protein